MAKRGWVLATGIVTTIGSLPHAAVEDAVDFVLAGDPDLPAAPQLPGHDPAEGMLAQVLVGVPGVTFGAGGRMTLDPELLARITTAAAGRAARPLDPSAFGGTLAFLAACASAGRRRPVKLQLAGPVTVGTALVEAGAPVELAYRVALDAVVATVADLRAAAGSILPGLVASLWLDEPGLVRWAELAAAGVEVTGLLRSALAALGPDAVTGVHCCGATDWELVTGAGPTVLSMPVDIDAPVGTHLGPTLDAHLHRGGWIAWGAVPTDRPVSLDDEEPLWQKVNARWSALVGVGCDPVLLRRRALVTPACGLAGLTPAAAATVVALTRRLGLRVATAST